MAVPSSLVPSWELRVSDFARHLQLTGSERTVRSYLDVVHRLAAFGVDPLAARRGDLERFLGRPRRGRHGDWQGGLSASTQTTELAGLRRFYAWAREEGLREDDPTQGLRPPRREPYAGARALSAQELARILAVIPGDHVAGLRLRALILAYLLTGRRRQEVLRLR